jgi:hypothetical protein
LRKVPNAFTGNGRSRRSGRFFPPQSGGRQCGGLLPPAPFDIEPFDMEPFDMEPLDIEPLDIEPAGCGFFFIVFGFVLV